VRITRLWASQSATESPPPWATERFQDRPLRCRSGVGTRRPPRFYPGPVRTCPSFARPKGETRELLRRAAQVTTPVHRSYLAHKCRPLFYPEPLRTVCEFADANSSAIQGIAAAPTGQPRFRLLAYAGPVRTCPSFARPKGETRELLRKSRYREREQSVEPVFGQIKEARGLRQFLLRGLGKVAAMWQLECAAHNLLKLYRSRVPLPSAAG